MPPVELRYPKLEEKEDFLRAMNEDWQGWDFVFYWDSLAKGLYEDWIQYLPGFPEGRNLPKGHVPSTFLCAFNEKGQIVGRVSIRHELNEFLEREGGHIGYGVCPSFRRQGYATSILKETLSYIKKNLPHLQRVLITCDDDNIGSIKTIEKNGGVLQDKIKADGEVLKRRYWIVIGA